MTGITSRSAFWTIWHALHPDIRACVSHIDIMRMGHAMVRPAPGFQFGEDARVG